jgi:hypothetical protein
MLVLLEEGTLPTVGKVRMLGADAGLQNQQTAEHLMRSRQISLIHRLLAPILNWYICVGYNSLSNPHKLQVASRAWHLGHHRPQ